MRRRKLLISIGALGAGGTAAFGTEAFTSVEAERSVDVTVAGDESAFLAIQALSGNNANEYVSTEGGDETVALDFDGDAGTDGSGVNQDAVTQVEDLFKIINQGTQPTSVFFEDDSDAVTFRVTQSTDTSTKGPSGESLEGADNSVELETGEQVAVGITVDTLNNDVSGSLVDDVTIRAEAGASAPEQNIPEPQFVVTESPDGSPNQFGDVQSAINQIDSDNESESGAVIGIEGGFNNTDNQLDISVPGVTLTGFNGSTPQIGTLDITAGDVTVKNVDVDGGVSVANETSDVTIDGVTFDGNENSVGADLDNLTITNSIIQNGGVKFGLGDNSNASAEISNNSVDADDGIGISVTSADNGNLGNLTIENNEVTNVDSGESGIKVDRSNVNINRETGKIDAIESLLAENGINTATVNGTTRQRSILSERTVVETVDDLNDRAGFTSIQDAINGNSPVNDAASEKINAGGTILVENGTFDESVTIDVEGLTLEGQGNTTVINGSVALDADGAELSDVLVDSEVGNVFPNPAASNNAINVAGSNVNISDVTVDLTVEADSFTEGLAIEVFGADASATVADTTITGTAEGPNGTTVASVGVSADNSATVTVRDSDIDVAGSFSFAVVAREGAVATVQRNELSADGSAADLNGVGFGIEGSSTDATAQTVTNNTFDGIDSIEHKSDDGTLDVSDNSFTDGVNNVEFLTSEGGEISTPS